jgi:hypothetical protein
MVDWDGGALAGPAVEERIGNPRRRWSRARAMGPVQVVCGGPKPCRLCLGRQPKETGMAKKAAKKVAKKAAKSTQKEAMERVDHAIDVLDEAQAILSGHLEVPEFWVGIIFSAQTSLRLVSEMVQDAEREAGRTARRKRR